MEQQIAEVMAAYRTRELSAAIAFPNVTALEQERAELLERQGAWSRSRIGVPRVTDVATEWDRLTIEQRRAIIETVLEAVVLRPPPKRGVRVFDPERLEAVWKV